MAGNTWITPELLVLGSGAEAQADSPASGKGQPHAEGVGDSCTPGIGCPGEEQIIVGPS
jgi:hypothetical protein